MPVPLNLYLDDCSNSDLLADLLRHAGHQVVRPADAGVDLDGADDDEHFAFAATNGLTSITKSASDLRALHDADPNHAGIFALYQDNDPSRDMSDAEIVKAIANLEHATTAGGEPIPGKFHSLNDWRY